MTTIENTRTWIVSGLVAAVVRPAEPVPAW